MSLPDELNRLPPSSKLVFKVLQHEGPLTQKAIATETQLPTRTVRNAVDRLGEVDVLEERLYPQDARQSLYVIPEGSSNGTQTRETTSDVDAALSTD